MPAICKSVAISATVLIQSSAAGVATCADSAACLPTAPSHETLLLQTGTMVGQRVSSDATGSIQQMPDTPGAKVQQACPPDESSRRRSYSWDCATVEKYHWCSGYPELADTCQTSCRDTVGCTVATALTSEAIEAVLDVRDVGPAEVVRDVCGCEVGEEGWSSTRNRCHPDSETSADEKAACANAPAPPPLEPNVPAPPPLGPSPTLAQGDECLCVFDIDRTLTGKQLDTRRCPQNQVLDMEDHGYGGGRATLSELSATGLSSTFCKDCFLGIVSAGHGSGAESRWNAYILDNIMRSGPQDYLASSSQGSREWSYGENVRSPWVLGQRNKHKQNSVEGIRNWYAQKRINIPPGNVYFFGDRTENIQPFQEMGFNSREVSCGARDRFTDGGIGYCGATPNEIQKVPGNLLCADNSCSARQGDDAVGSNLEAGVVSHMLFDEIKFCGEGQLRLLHGECPRNPDGCKRSDGWEIIGVNGGLSDCKHVECDEPPCCAVFKCGGQFRDEFC